MKAGDLFFRADLTLRDESSENLILCHPWG
jgi:hypothetical protein